MNIQHVRFGKIAFCKTEIIDGIQQVGFSFTVQPADTHDPFRKKKSL
jgi:hypothetical protein